MDTRICSKHVCVDLLLCRSATTQIRDSADLGGNPQAELTQNLRSAESHRYMQGEFLCVYDSSLRYATTKCAPPKFCSTQFCVGAKTWADLFIQHVFCNQGLPLKFISDSGAEFAGKYNQALSDRLRISWNMSTAIHPQPDGQTERMNRTVEDMLRHFVSPTMTCTCAICYQQCLAGVGA